MDMILPILKWWLALQVICLVGMPVTILLFQRFPLHGYALNKSVSVLLVGYVSWLLAMLGFGPLKSSSAALALCLIGGIGLWLSSWENIKKVYPILRKKWQSILVLELLFIVFLLAGLWLRGHGAVSANILGTEKLMDLGFLSGIVESPNFPPQDPWLAGYAINYYYLGYVFLSVITVLSGVSVGEAFNLGLATTFALTALTMVGLVTAMIRSVQRNISTSQNKAMALTSLLAIVMVLLIGNQAGAFQVIFGSPEIITLDDKQFLNAIRQRLDGDEIIQIQPAIMTHPSDFGLIDTIEPTHMPFNWWWPSRAVWDTVSETPDIVEKRYAITEFPFFSFYLGDLHPHVLALP